LEEIARRHGASVAQLALAWLVHRDVVPIPGTRRVANLEANAAAAGLTLSREELEEIESIVGPDAVAGERGARSYMEGVNA
jgi:aryl-alcohol dehydrogenase-like predicted oxidoreductase